jgi:DNA-binding XRE family transcriptional regulator
MARSSVALHEPAKAMVSQPFAVTGVMAAKTKTAEWWPRYKKKMHRGKFHVSMKQVAEAAAVTYSQVNRWQKGHGDPSVLQAAGMVQLVGASLDEIFIPHKRAKKLAKLRIAQQQRKRLASRKKIA